MSFFVFFLMTELSQTIGSLGFFNCRCRRQKTWHILYREKACLYCISVLMMRRLGKYTYEKPCPLNLSVLLNIPSFLGLFSLYVKMRQMASERVKIFKILRGRLTPEPPCPPPPPTGMGIRTITIDQLSANLGPLTLKFAITGMSQSSYLLYICGGPLLVISVNQNWQATRIKAKDWPVFGRTQ